MRRLTAIVLLGLAIAVAPGAAAMAQPGGSPAAPQTAPANPAGAPGAADAAPVAPSGNDARADAPPAHAQPDRASDSPSPRNDAATSPAPPSDAAAAINSVPAPAGDAVAASPRTEAREPRIFGLSVLAATLIAGALLLAIVMIVGFARTPRAERIDGRHERLP